MGWVTVAAYGITAILCLGAMRKPADLAVRSFWLILSLLLLALMINKQLDLQSALTAAARCLSQMQGWYEDRRSLQIGFILVVAFSGIWIAIVSLWLLRRHLGQIGLALLGLIALICFVMIRAAGFHNVDALLSADFLSIRMNWVLELSGVLLIAINAIFILAKSQRRATV